ncbi:MAG TPA: transglycosylase SLT domain-containing protein, partial [bacterium]|nr:transglycosylase SLT domain-containing protein [bacterium]
MAVNIFDPKPAAPEAPTSSSDIFAGTPLAGVSQSSNRAATPEQIRRWVEQYARQYGVPLDLALRLVNQESGFRSNAVSSAGAIGPAQLMPATARELGVNPRDPEANVRAGMDYLAQKYREFGNWQEALAAYNAGSGAVRSGRALSIPETANYVRSILSGTAFASRPAEASARPGGVDIFAPPTTAPTLTIPGGADIFAPGAAQPATSATKPAVQEHEGVLQYGMDLLHGIERGLTLGFIRPEDAKTQAGRIVEGIGNMIGQTPAVILAMMATEGLAAPMLLRVGLAGAMVGTGEAGVGSAVHGEPVSRIPGAAVSSGASFMAGEGILRLFAPIIRAIASKLGRSAESVAEDVARQARQTGQTPQQILDRINRGADQLSLFDEGARQGLVEQAAERRTPSPASLIRGLAGTGLESQPVGIVAPGFKAANELTDAVQQFVRNTLTPEPAAGSIEDRLYTLGTRSQEAEIRARHLLESIQGTMREADPENVLIHYDENHSIPLTPEQRQVYDTVIRPLKDATAQIFARLRGLDPNTLPDEFTNHYVQERGNLVDRALSGARRGFSLGGRLSTAASFLKGRTMKAIEDDQGHRYVVAIKDGRVTAFANGVREDLGAFKFRTLDELKAQELAPIQRRIGKLSQDIRALSSVKTLNLPQRVTQLESEIDSLTSGLAGAADEAGVPLDARIQAQKRDLAAAVRELKTLQGPARNVTRLQGRLNTLAQKVEDLKAIALEIGTRYDPASAKQRVFVPSKGSLAGRRFTVRDATIKEIESNTDLRYHKDILATRLLTYLKAVRVNNNLEFLETLKTDPQFASIGR